MQADIEIHKAAKLASPHFLWSQETGARSSLYSEPARAASSVVESIAEAMALRVIRVTGYGLLRLVTGYGLLGCGLLATRELGVAGLAASLKRHSRLTRNS